MLNPTEYGLGRLIHHDPRSRDFPAKVAATHKPVSHRHYGAVLDQGNLGSCTGNAMAQALNTVPFRIKGRVLREKDAIELYSAATRLDVFPGEYPPTDTGATGLAVAKAAQQHGYIDSYTHAFGFDQFLGALQLSPVLLGIGWHQSMFTPDARGYVHPDGNEVGGHEIVAIRDDAKDTVTILNSWGSGWGMGGMFKLSYADLRALLADHGDATVINPIH